MDSSAARGIFGRTGPGRVRHLDTRHLWVQERVRRREMAVESVRGDENEADLGTKILTGERVRFLSAKCGLGPPELVTRAVLNSLIIASLVTRGTSTAVEQVAHIVVAETHVELNTYGVFLSWRAVLELVFYLLVAAATLVLGRRAWTTTTTNATTTTAPTYEETCSTCGATECTCPSSLGSYSLQEETQTHLSMVDIDYKDQRIADLEGSVRTKSWEIATLRTEAVSAATDLTDLRRALGNAQEENRGARGRMNATEDPVSAASRLVARQRLLSKNVEFLRQLCREAFLTVSGNKEQLVDRLLLHYENRWEHLGGLLIGGPSATSSRPTVDLPTVAQIGYINGAARRQQITAPPEVFRCKVAATQWLDRHGDYNH
jgi:hypothetical protein